MFSNAHDTVRKNVEESIFYCFDKKLYKRFSIERLKVLEATNFEGTINPTDAGK